MTQLQAANPHGNLLNPLYHLQADHAARLEVKLVAAGFKEVLEALAQHFHDHHVELVVRYRLVRSDVVQVRHVCYGVRFGQKSNEEVEMNDGSRMQGEASEGLSRRRLSSAFDFVFCRQHLLCFSV